MSEGSPNNIEIPDPDMDPDGVWVSSPGDGTLSPTSRLPDFDLAGLRGSTSASGHRLKSFRGGLGGALKADASRHVASFRARAAIEDEKAAEGILAMPAVMTSEGLGEDAQDEDAFTDDAGLRHTMRASIRARSAANGKTKTMRLRRAAMWESVISVVLGLETVHAIIRKSRAISKLQQLMLPIVLRRSALKAKRKRRLTNTVNLLMASKGSSLPVDIDVAEDEDLPEPPTADELQRKVELLAPMSNWVVSKIIEKGFELIAFDDRDVIIKQGEIHYGLYYVARGACLAIHTVLPTSTVGRGEFLGSGASAAGGGNGGAYRPNATELKKTWVVGDVFGDILGVPVAQQSAIVAKGLTLLWRMTKPKFDALVKPHCETNPDIGKHLAEAFVAKSESIIPEAFPLSPELFARASLFRLWNPGLILQFKSSMKAVVFRQHDVIFAEDQPASGIFIVLSGDVGVYRKMVVEPNGNRAIGTKLFTVREQGVLVETLRCDDPTGAGGLGTSELQLIGEKPYVILERHRYTYVVLSPLIQCWYIDDTPVNALCTSNPEAFLGERRKALDLRAKGLPHLTPDLLVRSIPLLQNVPTHRLEKLASSILQPRVMERNAILTTMHEEVKEIYIITSGDLRCVSGSKVGRSLREVFAPKSVEQESLLAAQRNVERCLAQNNCVLMRRTSPPPPPPSTHAGANANPAFGPTQGPLPFPAFAAPASSRPGAKQQQQESNGSSGGRSTGRIGFDDAPAHLHKTLNQVSHPDLHRSAQQTPTQASLSGPLGNAYHGSFTSNPSGSNLFSNPGYSTSQASLLAPSTSGSGGGVVDGGGTLAPLLLHLGGAFEGLVVGRWTETWKASSVVEYWSLSVLALRTEYYALPKPVQAVTLTAARLAQQIALKLEAPMTGPLPPLLNQARKSKAVSNSANGVAKSMRKLEERRKQAAALAASSSQLKSPSPMSPGGATGNEVPLGRTEASPSITSVRSPFKFARDGPSGAGISRERTSGEFRATILSPDPGEASVRSLGEDILSDGNLKQMETQRRPSAQARDMSQWLTVNQETSKALLPRGRRHQQRVIAGSEIQLSESEIQKRKLRKMPMQELIAFKMKEAKKKELEAKLAAELDEGGEGRGSPHRRGPSSRSPSPMRESSLSPPKRVSPALLYELPVPPQPRQDEDYPYSSVNDPIGSHTYPPPGSGGSAQPLPVLSRGQKGSKTIDLVEFRTLIDGGSLDFLYTVERRPKGAPEADHGRQASGGATSESGTSVGGGVPTVGKSPRWPEPATGFTYRPNTARAMLDPHQQAHNLRAAKAPSSARPTLPAGASVSRHSRGGTLTSATDHPFLSNEETGRSGQKVKDEEKKHVFNLVNAFVREQHRGLGSAPSAGRTRTMAPPAMLVDSSPRPMTSGGPGKKDDPMSWKPKAPQHHVQYRRQKLLAQAGIMAAVTEVFGM
jgi:CRP-like cAMP-binding protein